MSETKNESVKKLAKQYYPRLWSSGRIESLVEAGKLSRQEADEIMAEQSSDLNSK